MDHTATLHLQTARMEKKGAKGNESLSKGMGMRHKAVPVYLTRGQVIMMDGNGDDQLYFLLNGKAKAVLFDETGREHVIDVIEKGGLLGELCLADGASSALTFLAMEDCHLLMIRKNDLLGMVRDDPLLALTILKSMSEKLRNASEKIRELSFCTVKDRIINYLVRIGRESDEELEGCVIIRKPPSHEEIARFCGCCRETVSRMIKELIAQGVLVKEKKSYTLRLSAAGFSGENRKAN